MAKLQKLPSGNYRTLVYLGKDKNGKRKYKSITAPTVKECKFLASKFNNSDHTEVTSITVSEAIDRYINAKSNVLSPSTVRAYRIMWRNSYALIENKLLRNLTQENVQIFVNEIAYQKSPKSIRNAYGLLRSSIAMFRPSFNLKVTLPTALPYEKYVPTDAEVKKLLELTKDTLLEIPIMLAAFGSLREGEICALVLPDDLKPGGNIRINKVMVLNPDQSFTLKHWPKSHAGFREVELPKTLLKKLKKIQGKATDLSPAQISTLFRKLINKTDLPKFRFHDLRAYYASVLHALGVPDQYIMERGGWGNLSVLKKIYQKPLSDKEKGINDKIFGHFDSKF